MGSNITSFITIGVIIVVLIVAGPLIMSILKDLKKVADDGTDFFGAGTGAAGRLLESSGYCLSGEKLDICSQDTLDKLKEQGSSIGGYDMCQNCTPPCLLKSINCTKIDVAYYLGLAGASVSILAGIYGSLKGKSGKDAKNSLENDGRSADNLTRGGKIPLDKVNDEIENDPDGESADRARAEQEKRNAEESERKAQESKDTASKEAENQEQQEAEQEQQEAREDENKVKEDETNDDDKSVEDESEEIYE